MIHLITTMNNPCLHFELNEAWILSPEAPDPGDAALMRSTATKVADTKVEREKESKRQTPLGVEWRYGRRRALPAARQGNVVLP